MMLSTPKRIASLAARTAVFSSCVNLLERMDRGPGKLLRVLTYHRVDDPVAHPELSPRLLSATPQDFAQQMRHVAQNYDVVAMQDVLECRLRGRSLPARAVLITFDDAYQDFAEHAWPILRQLHLPATVFVATGYPDQPQRTFWWNRLHHAIATTRCTSIHFAARRFRLESTSQRNQAFNQLSLHIKALPHLEAMAFVNDVCEQLGSAPASEYVLSWNALRRLTAEGVTLGAHTQTHPLMDRIPAEQIECEIAGSLADLKHETGQTLPIFAYPGGKFSSAAVEIVGRLGVQLAFSTGKTINDLSRPDWLRLRRLHVGSGTSGALFRLRLISQWHLLKARRPLSGR